MGGKKGKTYTMSAMNNVGMLQNFQFFFTKTTSKPNNKRSHFGKAIFRNWASELSEGYHFDRKGANREPFWILDQAGAPGLSGHPEKHQHLPHLVSKVRDILLLDIMAMLSTVHDFPDGLVHAPVPMKRHSQSLQPRRLWTHGGTSCETCLPRILPKVTAKADVVHCAALMDLWYPEHSELAEHLQEFWWATHRKNQQLVRHIIRMFVADS